MFGISGGELAIVLVFGFLLFGPDKLPQMGRTIGRAMRQFRETQEKLTAVVQTEVVDPMAAAAHKPAPKKQTEAAQDDDADAPEATAAPARKETFAERRARLAAEKAAAQTDGAEAEAKAAPSAVPAQEESAPAAEASVDVAVSAPVNESAIEPLAEPEPATEPATAEPEMDATEALYARRPRKRAAAAEVAAAESADASTTEGGDR